MSSKCRQLANDIASGKGLRNALLEMQKAPRMRALTVMCN